MNRLMMIGSVAALAVTGCGSSSSTHDGPAAAAGPPAKAAAAAPSAPQSDPVTLSDFLIRPTATVLRPGKVTFTVKNAGRMEHEFVVLDTSRPAGKLGDGTKVPETGNVGETGGLAPGASKTIVLNLRRGHYAVICNVPGHYMAGMHRDLYVT